MQRMKIFIKEVVAIFISLSFCDMKGLKVIRKILASGNSFPVDHHRILAKPAMQCDNESL